ncbi:Lrp/AsnC family transcriptional regulator [Streptomyces somaliensis DSM 40738]|uniref:Lrp/AsnC family transcriptional regulator n=1 Tax=Streptomyces somaliensis (strain ATCC 33201 / DSM 40738 / JCM 12659 / KCTC 9044 / NCTC 11332 / NRRL B-12077 / IP 733) TaxID=1134445 RepID=A0AA44IFB9_STRE0|nr:Lrp/AsnC family transcriptional regulator [Streptomyces somaliensis]MCQ0025006.1 Lrp/AsnC family transcriptional regulator [Streptomyces somaliensis DSM 40738]NKY16645.1 Lrp/AsnC family transcriptional regulator [Streptomyces somaliensis DSM 40738]
MADSVITFDRLDRRIVGALQVDGRAEAARVAGVLGVSARTVSRRLARMRDAGALRVVRLAPPDEFVGAAALRVRVSRGRGEAVAEAFAARPDVLSVDLVAGGEEISVLLLGDGADRDRLLYRQVPATAAITSLSVHEVLHVFADARQWRADVLTPEETAGLLGPGPGEPAGPGDRAESAGTVLDAVDRRLLAVLDRDARIGFAELGRLAGVPETTVRRRLRGLEAAGQLRTLVRVRPELLGLTVDADLWMRVPPARLREAGEALAAHPLTHAVAATTGERNLIAAVYCPDLRALYDLTTDVLGPLGVSDVETAVIARTVKPVGAGRG